MPDERAEASSSPGDDGALWQASVVDTIDDVVSSVHDRVIQPLLVATRAVVFGSIVATMALVVSILLSVALVRLLDVYAFGGRVWASDALVGGLFCVAGVVAWTRRRAGGDAGAP